MKLTPIEDKKKINLLMQMGMTYKYGRIQNLILEFIDSEAQISEITDLSGYKDVYSLTTSINASAKKMNISVRAFTRTNHVYIMKTL